VSEEKLMVAKYSAPPPLENFPLIIWTAHADGTIEYRSRRWFEYTGTSPTDAGATAWERLLHPDDHARFVARWNEAVRSQTSYQIDYRLRRADRQYRWHVAHAMPLHQGEKLVRWFGISSEIDALKETGETLMQHEACLVELLDRERTARAEAERANRCKDEFLATLSHELRTPLNAILGWAQLLRAGHLDAAKMAYGFEVLERNARRQAGLIEDLLDLSRIIAGKLQLQMFWINLGSIVESALDAVRPDAFAKGLTLTADIEPQLPQIWGDASRLEQVVWNLLSNAVKFTPSRGRVHVSVYIEKDEVVVEVLDSGKGIPVGFLPHVFERFTQAESPTHARGGLGLGLAIVSHLVGAHGGTVKANSAGEGLGACFTVRLPLPRGERSFDRGPGSDVYAVGDETVVDTLEGVRVLLVEDDEDTCELLRICLGQRGAEVQAVRSASEAVALVQKWRPSVLVSDMGLPGADGWDLVCRLRTEAGAAIPAVALSARVSDEEARRSLAAGFQFYLPKPVEMHALVSMITRLITE
jgi:PAS domain S-box-containing protein